MTLTLDEARSRAASIRDVAYELELDLTSRETFECRARVRFASDRPTTFLELRHAERVEVTGAEASYDGARVHLGGLERRNDVRIVARLPYVTDGEGLHTHTDPVDGETYVGAYCGLDVAQRVFPCFDQNDLKAPIRLRVRAPEAWTVLANGRLTARQGEVRDFAETPPLPPALFVVAAGPFASQRWEHAGRPFGWHASASLAGALRREAPWLRRITEAGFDHFTRLFTEPYPFDSYDQVFVPGLNWVAQEQPGCVIHREELLPLDGPTRAEQRFLATVVAHEMAHMWFGDLATMTWWEDTWLQESFADYLGYRVAEQAMGVDSALADFTVGSLPGAYLADQRRSTHPVAMRTEDVPDVAVAVGNFDSLSYAKGNALLRQLVAWLGDDDFLAGVNVYLARHRLGNATLADFVAALGSVTDRDVAGWVRSWLRTTGFDTIRVTRDAGDLVVTRDGSRPHRLRLTSYDDALGVTGSTLVDLRDEPVRVPGGATLLPNAGGETYARVRPDAASWSALTAGLSGLADPTARAIVWTTAFDLVECGELDAAAMLDLAARHLPAEAHAGTVVSTVTWLQSSLLQRHVRSADAGQAVRRLASICRAGLTGTTDPELAVTWARALGSASADADELESWLAGGAPPRVDLDPTLRWRVLRRLAALGRVDADRLAAERASDGSQAAVIGEITALAARPDPEAKAQAWTHLTEGRASNRVVGASAVGLWDVEQAELLAPWVELYAAQGPLLARTREGSYGQLLGQAFPQLWLTDAQLARFEEVLAGDVPTVLRRAWEDRIDDARRARG